MKFFTIWKDHKEKNLERTILRLIQKITELEEQNKNLKKQLNYYQFENYSKQLKN